MTLPVLIAECKAVRSYLFAPESSSLSQAALDRFDASKRVDRLIGTLERLAASPYASYVNAALIGGTEATLEEYESEVHQAARMGGRA